MKIGTSPLVLALFKVVVLLAIAPSAFGEETQAGKATDGVINVLIKVDSRGKVSDVSTPERLPPAFEQLLRQNVSEMIAAPAHRDGKPVSSQLVLKVSLESKKDSEGNFDSKFVAVDSQALPDGAWSWLKTDGNRYVLVDRNNMRQNSHLQDMELRTPRSQSGGELGGQPPPPPQSGGRN